MKNKYENDEIFSETNESVQTKGNFLGIDYCEDESLQSPIDKMAVGLNGEELHPKNPAEALAFGLICAHKHKHHFTTSIGEKFPSVASILSDLDHIFDFHESFPKEKFLEALGKTFRAKFENIEDFIQRLDGNIVVQGSSEYVNNLIKRRMMSQVETFIKMQEEAGQMEDELNKKTVLLQLYGVSNPPKGYSKMDLLTEAQNCIFRDKEEFQKVIEEIGIFSKKYDNLVAFFPELKAHFKTYEDLTICIEYLTQINNEELLKNNVVESAHGVCFNQ